MGLYRPKLHLDLWQLLFHFVMIDILFFPYFTMMSVSYSVPIVVLWAIMHCNKLFSGREESLIKVLVCMMAISTMINPVYPWGLKVDTSMITAVKRFVQYSVSLILLVYFKESFKKYTPNVNKFLVAFVFYVFAFSVVFFFFPQQYADVKILINPADNHTRYYLQGLIIYRFNYLWTDPNNVAYAISGISSYLMIKGNLSAINKMFVVICSAFIIMATSSAGGIISFVLVIGSWLILKLRVYSSKIKMRLGSVISLVVVVIILYGLINQTNVVDNMAIPLIEKFQERMEIYQTRNDISGGRGRDFMRAFLFMNPTMFLVGSGHEGVASEIGHFYWIGLYGGIAYIIFLKLLFGRYGNQKLIDYVWILPFFIGFTMNTGIGEYKWLAVYILILSFSRYGFFQIHKVCSTES